MVMLFSVQERLTFMKLLSDLEQQMISCLSSDVRLLNELSTTKKLAELKKQYDEAQERWTKLNSYHPFLIPLLNLEIR